MDPLTSSIVTGLVVATVSGIIISWIRRKWRNADLKRDEEVETAKERKDTIEKIFNIMESQKKDIWRLNKTVLIMAKIIDDQTEKAHGDLNSSLEDIATELLREQDKN